MLRPVKILKLCPNSEVVVSWTLQFSALQSSMKLSVTRVNCDKRIPLQLSWNQNPLNYVSSLLFLIIGVKPVLTHANCIFDIAGFGEIGEFLDSASLPTMLLVWSKWKHFMWTYSYLLITSMYMIIIHTKWLLYRLCNLMSFV